MMNKRSLAGGICQPEFGFTRKSWLRIAATVFVGGSALLSVSPLAYAQVTTPSQANPGVISRPEEQGIYKDQEIDRQKQLPGESEKTEIDVPETEKPESATASPRFEVTKINIEGNSVFTNEELRPIAEKYEGQQLSLDDLGKAVDEINQKYRDSGYLTSQAYVPPQDIENGVVKIQVVEGTVGDMSVTGNRYFKTWTIERSIRQEPGDVLNIKDLEGTLNRVNQQNAFRLKAILKAGDQTGETDIDFQVAERQPWQISPTFDNQGRPFIGTYRWGVEVQNNNLLGFGDRLFLKWLMAARTQVAAGSYFVPVTRFGTEIGASYTFSYVDLDLHQGPQPRIQGFAHNYSAIISQPLDPERVFTVDGAFNVRRVTTWIDGVKDNASQTDVRSLTAGLTINKLDRWGRTFLRAQSDFAPKGWLGSNVAFWKSSLFATRLHRLPYNSLLILRGSAQFTPDALPPIEQYQLGGAFSVRGFSEGLLIGDRGYNLSAEVRTPVPGLKYVSPWMADRVQLAGFADMGQVWLDRSSPNFFSASPTVASGSNSSSRTTLVGVGVGVRARLTRFLIGFVDLGWGLTNQGDIEPYAQPTLRAHFGIRSDLLPDTYRTIEGAETVPIKQSKSSAAAAQQAEQTEEEVSPEQ
ncbi:MAG: POTRA domain-containing protein [Vampirovibrionales bacterium]|nr:POTRA domain-containing protein [Vampirovibrionales bacterium]